MKVKKLLVNNDFVSILIKELIHTQTSYVMIDYDIYKELHVESGIYRFFSIEKKESVSSIFCSLENKEELSNVNVETEKEPSDSSGYRRLTKQAIKLQNQRTSNIRGIEYGKNKLSNKTGRRIKKFKQKEKYFTA